MVGGHSVLTFSKLQPTAAAIAAARQGDLGPLTADGPLLEQPHAPGAGSLDVQCVGARDQPANIAVEHAVDPFAIIWAGPGFYRPHFTLVLVHKYQGEGTIGFIKDKTVITPGIISYGPVTSGPSSSSCAWSCHGAKGMVGLGRSGGGGQCPRNRRGNRATACNQNNGCGHGGGQCHNPQHPVFLHEPHWPPACTPGRPIQPDCPIKTVQASHSTGAKDNGVVGQSLGCNKREKGASRLIGTPL